MLRLEMRQDKHTSFRKDEKMIHSRNDVIKDAVARVAQQMLTAAVTAPKAHGDDHIEVFIVDGEDKDLLSGHMRDIYKETGADFFNRDAGNVDGSDCVLIIAVRNEPIHLDNCGYCGFANCGELAAAGGNCAFNISDLGIAVGSAVSVAADNRVDSRVMFSAGQAALRMGFLDPSVRVCYGIPISATTKSIYYDRAPGSVLVK